jgi:hypothetical protein
LKHKVDKDEDEKEEEEEETEEAEVRINLRISGQLKGVACLTWVLVSVKQITQL